MPIDATNALVTIMLISFHIILTTNHKSPDVMSIIGPNGKNPKLLTPVPTIVAVAPAHLIIESTFTHTSSKTLCGLLVI